MIGSSIGMTVPGVPSDKREQWAASSGLTENGIYNRLEVATPALIEYSSELIRMRDRAYISIITGDQPVGYFDTYVEEFKDAGGQQVLLEANHWYKEHKETSRAQ